MRTHRRKICALFAGFILLPAASSAQPTAPPTPAPTAAAAASRPDPASLSKRFDELYRSESSRGHMKMSITTPNYERTLEMDVLTRGMDDTMVRILSPRKERGIGTLKKGSEMWNYLPKVKKTIRVPPSMMMGSWMGSDFTNDDLVKATIWQDDFAVEYADAEAKPGETCLRYTPKPEAPVTWSSVLGCFETARQLPIRVEYYDEKSRLARIASYDDIGDLGGRTVPRRMTLTPQLDDKKGNKTVLEFSNMEYGVEVSPSDFSLTALQRAR